jgi:uncharacterized protein (TIGR00251 family)
MRRQDTVVVMSTDLFDVNDKGTAVLRVHVQPGAGKTAVKGRYGDALKVSVGAPPEGGRANKAVAELLAELLGVKVAKVKLVGGDTSRSKRFQLDGLAVDDLEDRLDRALDDVNRKPGNRW